ncbi:helix-turn-helix transcriptional regulator [Bradyrhizobium tropiciagri]|uniref:helix-turn-helix transcriptional regulator n=1 Tax=Bradyrhizobium tropiciagri TaxID=312253 RepID=UPI0032DEF6AC
MTCDALDDAGLTSWCFKCLKLIATGDEGRPLNQVVIASLGTLIGVGARPWSISMPRQDALPPTLAPRLISREAAAAYVCVSPNTFDLMVVDGLMPKPRLLGGTRIGWDVRELDAAVDALPHRDEGLVDAGGSNEWDHVK